MRQIMFPPWAHTGSMETKIVEFRNDLPKTTVGKILRRELRDKA